MRQKMSVFVTRRRISTFIVITLCLTGVIMPAMTQPALPLFLDASNATDGGTEEGPAKSPTLPLPSLAPTLTLMSSYTPDFHVALKQSMLTTNKAYIFTVFADSEKEIEEQIENNKGYDTAVGPDISVGEIYTELISDESCECTVVSVIKNEGNRSASNVSVRLKLNCTNRNVTLPEQNETIDLLPPNEEEKCTFKNVKVEPNKIYDVEVTANLENRVDEVNEENNEKIEMIGPDLIIEKITYHSEKGLEREGDKLVVGENQTIKVWVNNTGKVGAKDIHVKIEIKRQDGTIFHDPQPIRIDCFPAGVVKPVNFSLKPQERGWFVLNATVDVYNNTPEWNEENNNMTWQMIKTGYPGYKAKEGFLVAKDRGTEFNGGIKYTVGDTQRLGSSNPGKTITTDFGNPIPENASVRSATLYVYPDWAYYEDAQKHKMAFLPDDTHLRVTFTGTGQPQVLNNPKYTPEANNEDEPVDIPDATRWNTSYATYSYDVTAYYDDTKGANNRATAERLQYPDPDYRFGIAGMALLIVYEDQDAPLTRYWVADDRDLIVAKTDSRESTGFEYEECTRKVQFEGAITDPHLANASLKTVLVPYGPNKALCSDAGGIADALYFNPSNINNPRNNRLIIETGKDDGHWHKVGGDIAITNENNGWAYVNVQGGINYAAIQSRGAMMGVAHAILKVTYPPDLVPSVDTPLRATVGNPYYIPITITNLGKSTAKKIAVRISIEGEGDHNETITELKGAGQEGGNKETIRIEKIAPPTEGIFTFNVTVVVDPENKVPELITKSHDGEANNNVTTLISVVVGERIQTFDTGYSEKQYPSISGIHKGTIVLNHTISINKMYTYACAGTGGHTKYIEISNESGIVAIGQWEGYTGDWHTISLYPSFRMLMNRTYNYTIHTGSYPQIIHEQNHTTSNGHINCTSFVDVNGFVHNDWIPAIRLWKEEDER